MASSYSKNCILKGTVDSYCLVCEAYLKSETDRIDHTAKPIHKKNLDSTEYVKSFEEDFIRKVKKGYFCELCNKLLPMMARVKIHVIETSHMESKKAMFFKRIGVNVIAFGKVVLDEKAWNGLKDESCAFCNTEYQDEEIHKNLLSHILNIIQIKVEVDEKKNIYRKIDEDSFQCLTCNMVLALNNIACHFEEDEHKKLYQECCDIPINKINKTKSQVTEDLKDSNKTIEEKFHDCIAMPLKETGVTEEVAARSSDANIKCNVLEERDATPSIEIGEDEKEAKNVIGSPVQQEFKDTKENGEECVANPLNKTNEESNAEKHIDVNKPIINQADKKVKKNKTKPKSSELKETKKSGTSNETGNTNISINGFNIEEYEGKICKILKTEDYITLDENGKTLCILCDWIMNPLNKSIHIKGLHHQTMERMHKKRLAEMVARNTKENTEPPKKYILDLVSKFQANNVNINLLFNTAICKKCTLDLPFDVTAIEEHIIEHNKIKTVEPKNKIISESGNAIVKETSNTSDMKIKENNESTTVKENQKPEENVFGEPICNGKQVNIEEELSNETPLKDEAESSSEILVRQELCYYINILTGVKYMLFKDMIINDNICISLSSFHFLMTVNGEMRCLICEEEVINVEAHINILQHIKMLNKKPLIINDASEFVREIRPGLLHCGFCNITVPSWSEMQEHFNSSCHRQIKNAQEWRTQLYLNQMKSGNYSTKPLGFSIFSCRNMLSRLYN